MKRSLVNIAMALCIGLFASCSQEEIISASSGEVETVSIDAQLPRTVGTRALPEAAAGHQLRCILEVWDKAESGQLITRIEKLASEATDGKLQFAFTVGKDVTYQCLLWADYIAADAKTSTASDNNTKYADKYFNTTSLKAIDFAVTDAALFNNVSTDAFCGAVSKNGTTSALSVTLKRPFTKVTLIDNSEYINECKSLVVEYNTPSGYNIATGTTTTTKAVKAAGLAPKDKTWFSTFIFASTDKKKLDQDILMNVTKADGSTEKKTIKKDQITLDGNVENNAEANFSADDDVNIDVDIDPEFPDPNALKIGQFVNKDGSVSDTYNAETAIGIVYAAAKGKTDTSNYGEAFAGKTIAGYAMALTSVSRDYLGASKTDTEALPVLTKTGDTPFEEGDYNGYSYTNAFLTTFGNHTSAIIGGYKTWVEANQPTSGNLSAWYIPSGMQIKNIGSMLFGYKESSSADAEVDETVKSNALITAYNAVVAADPKAVFDLGGTTTTWIMSSYCTTVPKSDVIGLAAITTTRADAASPIQAIFSNVPVWKADSRFVIRPVLTIFK